MPLIAPLLFVLYPVLHLYLGNYYESNPADVIAGTLEALAGTTVLYFLARAVFKDSARASLWTTAAALSFYSFPVFLRVYVKVTRPLGTPSGAVLDPPQSVQWLTLALMVLFLAALGVGLARIKWPLDGVARASIRYAVILLLVVTFVGVGRIASLPTPRLPLPTATKVMDKPDIILIILDAYGRTDILAKDYGYDDSDFRHQLEAMGFQMPPAARANYPSTDYSLSSALNWEYLTREGIGVSDQCPSKFPLTKMIENNRATRFLKSQGYQIVNVYGGLEFTKKFEATDLWVGSDAKVGDFEYALLKRTPLSLLGPVLKRNEYDHQHESVLEALEILPDLPRRLQSPFFICCHIFGPHDPFVFTRTGGKPYDAADYRWSFGDRPGDYPAGYRDQAGYLAERVLQLLPRLEASCKRPPVILIMGDHGPGSLLGDTFEHEVQQRFPNLCALKFPGQKPELPPTLSPVNYFRVVFNQYFGTDLPILPDRSFVNSSDSRPFVFREVTNLVK